MSFVPIIMGSKADLPQGKAIAEGLSAFGIASELRVASAHKAAHYLLDLLAAYETDPRSKVYITVAGRSNALSGLVDANVRAPVIACPPYSERFGGVDLFSSLRMPSGIAPIPTCARGSRRRSKPRRNRSSRTIARCKRSSRRRMREAEDEVRRLGPTA